MSKKIIKIFPKYANGNDDFLYHKPDIEKVKQLLARNGLRLPTPLKLSDSNIRVPKKNSLSIPVLCKLPKTIAA